MTVVIGFDDSSYGRDAIALGLNIAARRHEPVEVVTAYPDDERGLLVAVNDRAWVRKVRGVAKKKLAAAEEYVASLPPTDLQTAVTYKAIGPASASRAMHEHAEKTGTAVLVVGSSARAAIGRIALGSTVERLLSGAPCPVAVAPRGYSRYASSLSTVAVAYDGSPESETALQTGAMIARRDGLALRIVAVRGSEDPDLAARLRQTADDIGPDGRATGEVIVASDAVETLADLPGLPRPDILVCGSRGYGALRQILLGSVSARVIRNAAYPVVVVPRGWQVTAGER